MATGRPHTWVQNAVRLRLSLPIFITHRQAGNPKSIHRAFSKWNKYLYRWHGKTKFIPRLNQLFECFQRAFDAKYIQEFNGNKNREFFKRRVYFAWQPLWFRFGAPGSGWILMQRRIPFTWLRQMLPRRFINYAKIWHTPEPPEQTPDRIWCVTVLLLVFVLEAARRAPCWHKKRRHCKSAHAINWNLRFLITMNGYITIESNS